MLSTLRIKNLALAADLTIDFQPGLNVITGETGAGKSVLIGALNLVLGERADRNSIRGGADRCVVEAVFDVSSLESRLQPFFEDNGIEPCEGSQLVLKRSFSAAGANRQFVNGSPATVSALGKLGQWLVDIHGPHDHQSLLNPGKQLEILDAFGGLTAQRRHFTGLLARHAALRKQRADLVIDEQTCAHQLDLLRFQTHEIEAAQLRQGEDMEIEREHSRASNAARLLELSQTALKLLAEEETSLLERAGALGRLLKELSKIDAASTPISDLHSRSVETLSELQLELSRYSEKVEIEPARLATLEERLNLLQSLKRKYGPTLSQIVAFGEQARRKLAALEQRDSELERIDADLATIGGEMLRAGNQLTIQRRKLIPQLNKAVQRELSALGFKQSHFEVDLITVSDSAFASSQFSADGLDSAEFQFAPNPGEPRRPLRAIASSGELARVMLALKTVLAQVDEIPVLVFDEVDANIGGETAHAVGEKMSQIGRKRQVLCITHLAQVAAHGAAHYVVTKHLKSGRTYSDIALLGHGERVPELARMLGGQTEAATKHAQALLKDPN